MNLRRSPARERCFRAIVGRGCNFSFQEAATQTSTTKMMQKALVQATSRQEGGLDREVLIVFFMTDLVT